MDLAETLQLSSALLLGQHHRQAQAFLARACASLHLPEQPAEVVAPLREGHCGRAGRDKRRRRGARGLQRKERLLLLHLRERKRKNKKGDRQRH